MLITYKSLKTSYQVNGLEKTVHYINVHYNIAAFSLLFALHKSESGTKNVRNSLLFLHKNDFPPKTSLFRKELVAKFEFKYSFVRESGSDDSEWSAKTKWKEEKVKKKIVCDQRSPTGRRRASCSFLPFTTYFSALWWSAGLYFFDKRNSVSLVARFVFCLLRIGPSHPSFHWPEDDDLLNYNVNGPLGISLFIRGFDSFFLLLLEFPCFTSFSKESQLPRTAGGPREFR